MIEYKVKKATQNDLFLHLEKCNHLFVPLLSNKVNLDAYAQKLFDNAQTFEAWDNEELVGVVAAYCNDTLSKAAFISNVSVLGVFANKGIAGHLIQMTKEYATANGLVKIALEVNEANTKAIAFYHKTGFGETHQKDDSIFMEYKI